MAKIMSSRQPATRNAAPTGEPAETPAKRFLTRRRLVWAAIVLLLLGGAAWSLGREALSLDDWTRVERRDLVLGLDVEGELESVESASISPPQIPGLWNLKISMMIPEGTEVREGQPVLGFDTTQLQQQLQEMIAERDQAEKELEKKITDFEITRRNKELQLAEAKASLRKADLKLKVPERISARKDLEVARIDRHMAERRIEFLTTDLENHEARRAAELESLRRKRDRAAGRVEEIQTHLQDMTVKAPRAGTVIYKTRRGGDKKKVGDSTWRGEVILEIPDLDAMRAQGTVAEADAGRLDLGQSVTFKLDAYPDTEYRGTVSKIHRAVQRKSWSNRQKVVKLEIDIATTDTSRMRPGMRFRGTVEAERLDDVLVVPSEAVFVGRDRSTVVRRTLFGRDVVEPTFGKRNSEHFQVTGGLEEGAWVLRRGAAGGGS